MVGERDLFGWFTPQHFLVPGPPKIRLASDFSLEIWNLATQTVLLRSLP
jgi:hypothetical protein